MYSFRPASKGDEDIIYAIMEKNMSDYFQRFTAEGWSRVKFNASFRPERITVCEDNGEIVAFYDVDMMDFDRAYLRNIQVRRGAKPIGPLLLDRIEREVSASGKKLIRAKIFMANPAIRLALRHGFEITGFIDEENSYWVEKKI